MFIINRNSLLSTKLLMIFLTISVSFTIIFLSQPIYAQTCPTTNPNDTDNDGIINEYEINGVDINNDGLIDLNLPGANPLHKDVFIEIDYFKDHRPLEDAINAVINSFDKAPLCNPDERKGITLHINIDEELPHKQIITYDPGVKTIMNENFGTFSERTDPNNENIIKAKLETYYYGLFAHQHINGWSGQATIPGKYFVITLGINPWGIDDLTRHQVGNAGQQAGTLMHELGHLIGLRHGGDDHKPQYKPDYLSVMNYLFQMPTQVPDRPLDYSRCIVDSLNERNLTEIDGIGECPPFDQSMLYGRQMLEGNTCPRENLPTLVDLGVPIDYDRSGSFNNTNIKLDLTCDNSKDLLTSFDDWSNIILSPAASHTGGIGGNITLEDELTGDDDLNHMLVVLQSLDDSLRNVRINTTAAEEAGVGGSVDPIEFQKRFLDLSNRTIGEFNISELIANAPETPPESGFGGGVSGDIPIPQLIVLNDFDKAKDQLDEIEVMLGGAGGVIAGIDIIIGDSETLDKVKYFEEVLESHEWSPSLN